MDPNLKDCYYYYYSTCRKGTACPFRHCEAALGTETVCADWQQGSCHNQYCTYRHMEIQKNRSNIACYWESQAGGCRKPHCVFSHTRPRDDLGTILSEEEKIAAITSPPPMMAMPMADGPSPHDPYYDNLPQDNIVCNIESPAVQRVVINPLEEETDEESTHGTPVKQQLSRRLAQVQNSPSKVKKAAVAVIATAKDKEDDEPLNFAVKSLDEIRQEKFERAKKLIEEADRLLSQEAPELSGKIQLVKEKMVDDPDPDRERSDAAKKLVKVKVNPKSSADDLPEVKSYEEILREKALASMIAAKAKKLKQENEERQEALSWQPRPVVEEGGVARRVVMRRRSASPPAAKDKPTGDSVYNRLHTKHSHHDDRSGDSDVPVAKAASKSVKLTREARPNVKSRLGLKSAPAKTPEESPEKKPAEPKRSIRDRLGNQAAETETFGSMRSERLGITMSDFSSDGMSEEEEDEVKVSDKTSSEEERVKVTAARSLAVKVRENSVQGKAAGGEGSGDELSQVKVKSLEEILREKALKKRNLATTTQAVSLKRKIVNDKNKDYDSEEESPNKIMKSVTSTVTMVTSKVKPLASKVKPVTSKVKAGRRVMLLEEDEGSQDSQSSQGSVATETESLDDRKLSRQTVTMKPVISEGRKAVVRATRPKVSPPGGNAGKRDRKANVMLYRPPALKERETADVKSEKPTQKSSAKENKGWGVKTFSEILHEKQHQRKQQEMKRSLSPAECANDQHHEQDSKLKNKRLFSPIKFDSSDDKPPAFKKIQMRLTKNRDSPEALLGDKPDSTAPTTTTTIAPKKVKRSNIWSSRKTSENRTLSTDLRLEVSLTGARRIGVKNRVAEKESVSEDRVKSVLERYQAEGTAAAPPRVKRPSVLSKPPAKVSSEGTDSFMKSTVQKAPKLSSPVATSSAESIGLRRSSGNKERRLSAVTNKSEQKDVTVDDESLNLNDSDLLEAELLELLGGTEALKKTDGSSIEQHQYTEDDDLLLEELLS